MGLATMAVQHLGPRKAMGPTITVMQLPGTALLELLHPGNRQPLLHLDKHLMGMEATPVIPLLLLVWLLLALLRVSVRLHPRPECPRCTMARVAVRHLLLLAKDLPLRLQVTSPRPLLLPPKQIIGTFVRC